MFYSTLVNNYLGNWNTVTEGQIINHEARKKPLLLKIKDGEYIPETRCKFIFYNNIDQYIFPNMGFSLGAAFPSQKPTANRMVTIIQMVSERDGSLVMRYI